MRLKGVFAFGLAIEAQVVEMLHRLKRRTTGAMLVVSHGIGLIAELCDRVVVMYAGTVVESGPVREVLHRARHPYTRALLACEIDPYAAFDPAQDLATIPGSVPDPARRFQGCIFTGRCSARRDRCSERPLARASSEPVWKGV